MHAFIFLLVFLCRFVAVSLMYNTFLSHTCIQNFFLCLKNTLFQNMLLLSFFPFLIQKLNREKANW